MNTYNVDAWGNLTNKNPMTGKVTGENLQQTANVKNQFVGFSYDPSGNMQSDGTNSYTYDAENRVKSAAGMGYIYDGDGERVRKCVLDGNGNCTAAGVLYWGGSSKRMPWTRATARARSPRSTCSSTASALPGG